MPCRRTGQLRDQAEFRHSVSSRPTVGPCLPVRLMCGDKAARFVAGCAAARQKFRLLATGRPSLNFLRRIYEMLLGPIYGSIARGRGRA